MSKFLSFFICLFTSCTLFASANPNSGLFDKKEKNKCPHITASAIIEIYKNGCFKGVVLMDRTKSPWGKQIPGGHVRDGETVEAALRRHLMEKIGLEINEIRQFHVYSDPNRDPRHHVVEITHTARAYIIPKNVDVINLDRIPWNELAFDHAVILQDYLMNRNGNDEGTIKKP